MREIMLARIYEIKKYHSGFNNKHLRWRGFKINDKHISEIDFNELQDDKLINIFEQILYNHFKIC